MCVEPNCACAHLCRAKASNLTKDADVLERVKEREREREMLSGKWRVLANIDMYYNTRQCRDHERETLGSMR